MFHHRSQSPPRSLPLSVGLSFALAAPLALVALSGLLGCAAPAPPAMSPPEAEAPLAATPVTRGSIMAPGAEEDVAQQVAELRAAEAELEAALATGTRGRREDQRVVVGGAPSPSASPKVGAAAQKKDAPAKTPARRSSADDAPKEQAEAPELGDPCSSACAALASMSRATEHLCGLAGNSDARCEDARTRVRSAEGRVRAACPVCAAR
jgi:hypothetical protein